MTDRIIDISDRPAKLRVELDQLHLKFDDDREATMPLSDTAVVVVANRKVYYTHATLSGLMENRAVLVVCNDRGVPTGLCLPLPCHTLQGEKARDQATADVPLKKRLWKQLVVAKIGAQAACLKRIGEEHSKVERLVDQVRSGDPGNVEARAARLYWKRLFPDIEFIRSREGPPPNNLLNYGYTILRAMTCRALCAAGLYAALGLHHHHRANSFALADDIMEPFRPLVDLVVYRIVKDNGSQIDLDKGLKQQLIEAVTFRLPLNGEHRTGFDCLSRVATSLADVFDGNRKELLLPDFSKAISLR